MSDWLVCCPTYWGMGCVVELEGAGVRGLLEVMPVKCTPN